MKFYKKYISIVIVFFAFVSCRKFVEVNPPTTRLVSSTVYTTDASATSAVLGIYSGMMTDQFSFTSTGTTLYAALSADEFTNYSSNPTQGEFYKNSLSTTNTTVLAIWSNAYNFIYDANAVLSGLENSASLSPQTKKQLEGEAL
ncbi:MAG TPA: RagB/SusD family nutrient uptake outer membrane protein, partial [Chitinophagaceae bacterium]|nr:RagB/SusD family nutrient uptake outer membrane protein [Chitinophagaceae bacterium]